MASWQRRLDRETPGQEVPMPSTGRALVCVWGELRGIRAAAESMRRHLLEPLDAEALVFAQHQLDDDVERVGFLQDVLAPRLLDVRLYDKPRPEDFFGAAQWAAMAKVQGTKVRGNWCNPGNIQVLMNHSKLGEYLRSSGMLERYELFVFTRSDLLHVLPFPSTADMLAVLGPLDVITQAGHEFGGVNYNFIVMRRALVEHYLQGPHAIIASAGVRNASKTYNIERFMGLVLLERQWRNLRMPVTCFITADQLNDRSTWKKIKSSGARGGLLFKYAAQMDEAYRNLEVWERRRAWIGLKPPRRFQVEEIHGCAVRPFALLLEDPGSHWAQGGGGGGSGSCEAAEPVWENGGAARLWVAPPVALSAVAAGSASGASFAAGR
eukprot:CAMPEP_0204126264 /NCGR_PEP_ID=MMETSP0361-20130328/10895_1 /ASSEMBLY_ACC=CAM_ASM_000343 /TAXON_ID=268821 /ORGANISM="Scrippsiella Hangoei, Strain SHTV-5" /LENGTH=379 /DNA_ID=CAMNT_0051078097 /DNA_START=53 /DNA_END=1190 /DNA_ORIENTATION=+